MMVRLVVLLGIVFAGQTPSQKPAARDPLFSTKHLACSFPVYAAPVWKDGAAQVVSRAQDFTFDIDAIDTKKNSAQIVGKGGASAHASTIVTPVGRQRDRGHADRQLERHDGVRGGRTGGQVHRRALASHRRSHLRPVALAKLRDVRNREIAAIVEGGGLESRHAKIVRG